MIIAIDTRQNIDSTSFHQVFADAFGSFEGYGWNMDAWIDCMSGLDDKADVRLSRVTCPMDETVVLHLEHAADFAAREAQLFQDLLDCSAFVNWRRVEREEQAILVHSYHK